ncbi:MAG: hypothetical protein IKK82_00370, partial [Kiritimatiellae bacterium]|nr:hypothetical protein [Kiritimatiellia bacterium]
MSFRCKENIIRKGRRCFALFAFFAAMTAAFAGGTQLVASEDAQERVPPVFEGRLSSEFETAYLSTSGTLCDTRPTSLQNLDWTVHLGDYGKLYGYAAFLSMLHDRQH